MTWIRLRTWIGRHPHVAMGVVMGVCLHGLSLAVASVNRGALVAWLLWFIPEGLGPASGLVFGGLAIAVALVWPFLVGCVLGHAGLPVRPRWAATMTWTWLTYSFLLVAVVLTVLWPEISGPWHIVVLALLRHCVVSGLLLLVPADVCVTIGLALAAWITRRMIRRGRWEVTRPVGPAENRP